MPGQLRTKPLSIAAVGMTVDGCEITEQDVADIVRELHSYKTPCIASLTLHRMNTEFKEWMTNCIA